ncbi:IS30 family transposase [Streptomyces sp. R28]|uniref:IS30 family transposase n=1 Tax=Streptomyces sp. R28 TaxID=3238628 RepID=A0AB39PYG0_9ACTN
MGFKIRENRGQAQGRGTLVREREEYFRLMDQGLSGAEACKRVGINYRTGKRWRNGRAASGKDRAAPPVRAVRASEGPSRYLRQADRIHIADRLREKASVRQIAAELGRSPSTISREIRRNGMPLRQAASRWAYRPYAAQARSDARRPRPKQGKIGQNPRLRDFIQRHLDLRWSPEQICQALRTAFPDRPEMRVAHETVYQALYVQGRGELRRELARALRTGRVRRKPRRQAQQRIPRFTTPMVMISERPAEAEDRAVPGHWEGDLIIGRDGSSAIGTLVERATRYVMLLHLPDGRTAEQVRDALVATVQTVPAHLARSLTWDQGSEMAAHGSFTLATSIPVYFCDPASPWQRGSNENTNGLLRQYFPKATDLSLHSRERLDAVAAELNSRPRKTIGWETPAERLAKLLAATS